MKTRHNPQGMCGFEWDESRRTSSNRFTSFSFFVSRGKHWKSSVLRNSRACKTATFGTHQGLGAKKMCSTLEDFSLLSGSELEDIRIECARFGTVKSINYIKF